MNFLLTRHNVTRGREHDRCTCRTEDTIKTDKKQRRTMHIRTALEAEFEKQYDNRKAPGTNSFPELLYYF